MKKKEYYELNSIISICKKSLHKIELTEKKIKATKSDVERGMYYEEILKTFRHTMEELKKKTETNLEYEI